MSAYSDLIVADGAVAYWRLGEASSSNAVDEISANNMAWTNTAGVTWAVAGALVGDANTAVTLDGIANFPRADVSAVPLTATDNFTLECWVKPNTTEDAVGAMIGCGNSGSDGYVLDCTPANAIRMREGSGAGLTDATAALSTSVWSHVVGKRVSGVSKVFVNGVQADPGTNNTATPTAPTTKTYIGARPDGLWFFKGSLDEVAIYNSALSDATILAHYQAGVASPPYTIINGTQSQLVDVNAGGTDVDAMSYKAAVGLTASELAVLVTTPGVLVTADVSPFQTRRVLKNAVRYPSS